RPVDIGEVALDVQEAKAVIKDPSARSAISSFRSFEYPHPPGCRGPRWRSFTHVRSHHREATAATSTQTARYQGKGLSRRQVTSGVPVPTQARRQDFIPCLG